MVQKQRVKVQSQGIFTQTQLEILRLIVSGFTNSKEIAKARRKSIRATYKVLNNLLDKGFVRKIGTDFLLSQSSKKALAVSATKVQNKVRLHDVKVRIKILNKFSQEKIKLLLMNHFKTKTIQLKNNQQIIFNLSQIECAVTTRSVILTMPSIIADTPIQATSELMEMVFSMIPKLENRLNIVLMKEGYLNTEILSQHYAMIENAMAKLYNQEGKKFVIYDPVDGKPRIIMDNSFGLNELETTHNEKAFSDMEGIHPFMLGIAEKSPQEIRGLLEAPGNIKLMAQVMAQNQALAKDMAKAIQTTMEGQTKQIETNMKLTELSQGLMQSIQRQGDTNNQILYHLNAMRGLNPRFDKPEYLG